MKPSIEKLQKFFKLEADRGYDNKAVMGGLSQMLDGWINEARLDNLDENLIQVISSRLKDYDHLSEISRKETLLGLWARIKRELGSAEVQTEAGKDDSGIPKQHRSIPQPDEEHPIKEEEKSTDNIELDTLTEERKPIPSNGIKAALDANVTVLKRVGPRFAKTLERLGIFTLGDMLNHFPRRYDDYSKLKPINRLKYGEEVTIIGSVQSISTRSISGGKKKLSEAIIVDGSAAIRITWFNQPWIAQRLKKGMQVVISGRVEQYLGRLTMNNPEWESLEQKHLHTNRIVPVYPLTARITQRWLRNLMFKIVTYWSPKVEDYIP
jgi:ATP-dependent DNA helicase RecG